MIRVAVTARRESALRCAFCHDGLSSNEHACARCGTRLHAECWEDARTCPTLGCRARIILTILRGASLEHLIAWLASFAAVFATLVGIVPAFAKMFHETGLTLPALTEWFLWLADWVVTVGPTLGMAITVGSIELYRRRRRQPFVRHLFVGLTLAALAVFPVGCAALFLPLSTGGLCQKL